MRNALRLDGEIVERSPLRWTPAGIPIAQLRLAHRSRQHEAGVEREVQAEVAAMVAGPLAHRLDAVALGTRIGAAGFLAPRSRNVRSLVLHITEFQIIED
jgi:primosomal replication protein N